MKKILKSFVVLALVCAMALGLASCKKDKPNTPSGGDDTATVQRDVEAAKAGLTNLLNGGEVYVTTFGQADWSYMKEIVDEATDSGAIEDNQLMAADVKAGSVVIAVVGYTSKGISGDITQTGEIARAKAFAERTDITLVLCQLSGKTRRGDSSDPIIEAAVSGAKLVLINDANDGKGADFDGKYSTNWCKDNLKKLFCFSDEYNMVDYIKVVCGK